MSTRATCGPARGTDASALPAQGGFISAGGLGRPTNASSRGSVGLRIPQGSRRIWILVGIAVAVSALVGLAWAASLRLSQAPPRRGGIEDLSFTLHTDKIEYAPSETVRIVTNLTNIGDVTVTIIQSDSCGANVGFWDANGTIVYYTGFEQACLQVLVETPLAPGQSVVSSFEWGQGDFEGNQVPSGRAYRARGSPGGVLVDADDIDGPVWAEAWFFILSGA